MVYLLKQYVVRCKGKRPVRNPFYLAGVHKQACTNFVSRHVKKLDARNSFVWLLSFMEVN